MTGPDRDYSLAGWALLQGSMRELRLKKGEERRVLAGHAWVFANEVDVAATPLKDFAPGEWALVRAHGGARGGREGGRPLGLGYVNPASLICCRMMTRDPKAEPEALVTQRLDAALELRRRLFADPEEARRCRLVFGESDGLPGLVADRYGDTLVLQINTAGMEALGDLVIDHLQARLASDGSLQGVYLKSDVHSRELEGLGPDEGAQRGEVPDALALRENGLDFTVSLKAGQKTGWFYDQRVNRARFAALVRPADRVLDAFAYVGGFGLNAARAGGKVLCLDSSAEALERVHANADRNGLGVDTVRADAFEALAGLRGEGFAALGLDPPALIKRKKDVKEGQAAYRRLNRLAMECLDPTGGFLVTSSCSQHLDRAGLLRAVAGAAKDARRTVRVVGQGGQGPDHPVHPAMPETEYLKTLFLHVRKEA